MSDKESILLIIIIGLICVVAALFAIILVYEPLETDTIPYSPYNSNPLDEVIEPMDLNPSSLIEVSVEDLDLSNIIKYTGGVGFPINTSIVNITIKNICKENLMVDISVRKFTDYEEFFWARIWIDDGFVSSCMLYFINSPEFFDYDFRDNTYLVKANETLCLKIRYKFVEQTHPFCFHGNGLPPGSYNDGQIYPGYIYISDGEYWRPYIFGILT